MVSLPGYMFVKERSQNISVPMDTNSSIGIYVVASQPGRDVP